MDNLDEIPIYSAAKMIMKEFPNKKWKDEELLAKIQDFTPELKKKGLKLKSQLNKQAFAVSLARKKDYFKVRMKK